MKIAIRFLSGTVLVLVVMVTLALLLGGPSAPPPMKSIVEPFQTVSLAKLPALKQYTARDGTRLAYRYYPADSGVAKGSVVLLHGSGASSRSMHVIAREFAEAGFAAYALDVRGHGASGKNGDIAYVGQLEDDLADFVEAVEPAGPATLVGFSSGGGFALRFAGSQRQEMFAGYCCCRRSSVKTRRISARIAPVGFVSGCRATSQS